MTLKNTLATGLSRRQFVGTGLAAAALTMAPGRPMAQDGFPSETIEMLVHAGAGGGTDLTAHALMAAGRSELGWQMALVRRTGAGGAASHEYARSRPADGYTVIVLTSSQIATIASGRSPLAIDDLVAVARGTVDPVYLMVGSQSPYQTIEEFIEGGKSEKLNIGLVTVGGGDHIASFLFSQKAGMEILQAIPIASGGEVAINLVGGNLDSGMVGISEAEAQIRSGLVRPLVNFGEERSDDLPDVPTAREIGIDVVRPTVRGFAVLKDTPEDRLQILREGFMTAMQTQSYQDYLTSSGIPLSSVAPGERFQAEMKREHDESQAALKELGLM